MRVDLSSGGDPRARSAPVVKPRHVEGCGPEGVRNLLEAHGTGAWGLGLRVEGSGFRVEG